MRARGITPGCSGLPSIVCVFPGEREDCREIFLPALEPSQTHSCSLPGSLTCPRGPIGKHTGILPFQQVPEDGLH